MDVSWRLRANHWRYRYAAKTLRFLPVIGWTLIVGTIVGFFAEHPMIGIPTIVLCGLFVIPAAGLGCYRCHYNIFLPYRGPEYPEHGDSWTRPEVEKRVSNKVPTNCPKCGAPILTESS
jgi:hypothetical protein